MSLPSAVVRLFLKYYEIFDIKRKLDIFKAIFKNITQRKQKLLLDI
jgi:hypothetical protein